MNSRNFNNMFTPDYSHLTGLLSHLNTEELKAILNNDDKTNEIINDLKQVKDIETERELLLAGNKSIAEFNLSQKTLYNEIQQTLDSTYNKGLELKDLLIAAKANIESKSVAQSKETLLALLQAATSEIEDEAEATVDTFLKNELSVEDFLEKYLELKKLAHLRRIKSEKLVLMIQKGGNYNPTPEKPQRLRKPPAPPLMNKPVVQQPYPNYMPYPNNVPLNQNIPVAPSRPAPQPPNPNPFQISDPNSGYPSPFSYFSPYPMPQPSRFPPPPRKG